MECLKIYKKKEKKKRKKRVLPHRLIHLLVFSLKTA